MSDSIGPQIKIEGEKEFKQAISGINKDLSVLGSEMGKVTAQFGDNADSMEALTSKSNVYNKQIEEQKKKIETLKAALENSAKEFGENDTKTKNWQISLNKAEADLAKTEISLNKTTDKINNFGKESAESGNKIENAGQKAKSSGDDAEKGENGWSKLGSGLAKAGEMAAKATAVIGAAAVGAGTALVAATVSSANYSGEIDDMSQRTGVATEEFQKYAYAAKLSGMETSTLENAMIKSQKAFADAKTGSKGMSEAYAKLGIDISKIDNSSDAFESSITALADMEDETTRNALANDLFGKSYAELAPLLNAGSEGIAKLKQEAVDIGAVMSGDAISAGAKFGDTIDTLKTSAEGARNALGTVLMPMLGELAGEGTDLLGEFTKGISDADGDMSKMVDVVSETLTSVVNKIAEYLPQFIDAGMKIVSALGQALLDNLPTIITAAVTIITALVTGLVDALPQLIDGGLQLITALVQALIDNLPMIVEGALQLVTALANGIVEALPELIPALVDTVMMIVETLIDNIDMLIDAAIAIIMALADGLIKAIPALIEKAPVIISKLAEAITSNLPKIIAVGIELILELAMGLVSAIPMLVAKIPEIQAALIGGFTRGVSKFLDVGVNIVTGVWDGIKSMATWIKDKISDFFGGIVDNVKGLLGIHSPSKVFAGIGENMALGLGEGFGAEMDSVAKQINKSVPTSFDINGNYRINETNGSTYQQAQNINVYTILEGKVVAQSTSRIQSQRNIGKSRALGVVVPV